MSDLKKRHEINMKNRNNAPDFPLSMTHNCFSACKINFKQTCELFLGVGDICFVVFLVLWREEDSSGCWFSFTFVELHLQLKLKGRVRVGEGW